MSVFEVAGNEAFEALLPRRVPELQSDYFACCCDVFADEVDPNGRLIVTKSTFFVVNKFVPYWDTTEDFPLLIIIIYDKGRI